MNDLVSIINNQAVTSSRKVADRFGKPHKNVLKKIHMLSAEISAERSAKKVADPLNENYNPQFYESTYTDEQGREQPEIIMNRDGFVELVGNMNGKKAREWKRLYYAEFNRMERVIQEKSLPMWIEARKNGKLTRRNETDTIKKLVEYAKSQGSTHADKLYMTYSKLANNTANVFNRDNANVKELNTLDEVETMIYKVIQMGMAEGKQYKEIYQDCKRRLALWQTCTFRLT